MTEKKKFTLVATATVPVTTIVEARTLEEAIEKASLREVYYEFFGAKFDLDWVVDDEAEAILLDDVREL